MNLPNFWTILGLKSSPYFQDTLHFQDTLQESSSTKSLSLFVGREKEQRQLLSTIGSSDSSRQAVAGFPGVGKTTLVQAVKAAAKKANYCVANDLISITPEHSSDALLGQLIAGIYDAILMCNKNLKSEPEMKDARHFIEVTRQQNISAGGTVMGTGVEFSRSETISDPIGGLTLPARHIIKNLLKCALDNGSEGVILHLNNLENLSEANAEKAADLLRSVRDTGLMIDGLHLIVVGPTSAINAVINRHRQTKNVFSPTIHLRKLELSDVHKLLKYRYQAFQIDLDKSFHQPIDNSIVDCLYEIFNGDLRGMLKSLEYGMQTLLLRNTDITAPLQFTLNDFLPIIKELSERESKELEENLGDLNWERIVNWAKDNPDSMQTQKSLSENWHMDNVSLIMKELTAAGAVEVMPNRVNRKIQYLLTGNARLATYQIKSN